MSTEGGGGLLRNVFKIFFDFGEGFRGFEIADERQDSVVGRIVRLEKLRHVIEARRVQVVHRTHRGVFVREIVVGQVFENFVRFSIRLIIHAQAALFLDGAALVVEIGLRDSQGAHAVGFEEQGHVELIGRHALVIIRQVVAGRAVHVAAVHVHEDQVFALAHVLRALEHHVFKEMRKSRVAGQLVSRSDVVDDAERHRRRRMVFREHDAQAVLQRVLLDGNLYFLGRSGGVGPCGRLRGAAAIVTAAIPKVRASPAVERILKRLHGVLRPNVFLADTLSYFQ